MSATTRAALVDDFVPFVAAVTGGRAPVDFTAIAVERFVNKIAFGDPDDPDAHDLWTAASQGKEPRKEPRAVIGQCCVHAAHVAWVLAHRTDIPAAHVARSTCGKSLCVRPEHLALRRTNRTWNGNHNVPVAFSELVPPEIERLAAAQFGGSSPGADRTSRRGAVTVVGFASGDVIVFTPKGNISGMPRAQALAAAKELLEVDVLDIQERAP